MGARWAVPSYEGRDVGDPVTDTERWAETTERADPEDGGPLRLRSEEIAARRGWWAPSRAAAVSGRWWGWAIGQPAGWRRVVAVWLVGGGAIPALWLGWFVLVVSAVAYGWLILLVVWWVRSRRRGRAVAEARHRELLEQVARPSGDLT